MEDLKIYLKQFAEVQENVPLSTMTTLRIGGNARYVVYPSTILALGQIIEKINEAKLPYKVIGKGSNLLCSDKEYNGVIIRLDKTFINHYINEEECYAEAGCSIIALAYEMLKYSLTGLEFASGIPGTVGGVTFMNAGAYKSSMSEIIESVFVYRNGKCEWLSKEECEFSYRNSIFHRHPEWIILAVRMKLKKGNQKEIRELMDNRRERRMSSQPLNYPNAGSVFRNPSERSAWQYIEELGWRGVKQGGVMVSDKHANFIVNIDHGSAEDFLMLVKKIQESVKEKYDEDLIMEVEKFNWE